MSKDCLQCGSCFEPHKNTRNRQVYCSTSCSKKASYARKAPPTWTERDCARCGASFSRRTVAGHQQKYCSTSCRAAVARDKVPQRWRHVSSRYGMSPSKFDQMMREQDNGCAICGTQLTGVVRERNAPQVDHDHDTGEVRAILCRLCNTALGNFRDDPDLVANALAYLRSWKRPLRAVT